MEPNCYQFPQIVISSGEKGGVAGWECFWRRFVRRKAGLAGWGARSKLHQKPNIKSTVRRKL